MESMQSAERHFARALEAVSRTCHACLLSAALLSGFGQIQLRVVVFTGTTWMHSTGQGGIHRSQPVHSLVMTVCICLAAPMMASTGQACMHSVQPMHTCSSIITTVFSLCSP